MNSTLAKSVKEIQALIEYCSTLNSKSKTYTGHKTIYCISPYKTGTTFLAAAYPKEVSRHEPMQYLSLKKFNKNFDAFFVKRLNTLNLKLECSGFLSAYVSELAHHNLTKDFEYIVITRKPSAWINSVINYWEKLDYLENDYINTYYWKDKVGVDLLNFKHKSEPEQQVILKQLATFYLDFTKQSDQLKNVSYVDLHDIVNYVKILDVKIDEKALIRNDKKRVNKTKYYSYKNDELDEEYMTLVKKLKSKRA